MARSICLVTSIHIAHNPRLVKEANALQAAGYRVRAVATQLDPLFAARDEQLVAPLAWAYDPLRALPTNAAGQGLHRLSYWRTQLFRRLVSRLTLRFGAAERALGRLYPELRRQAQAQPADLFIAHNVDALPAAYAAARRWGARLGFDAEDLHVGEFGVAERRLHHYRLITHIEARYIGRCDYVSAPSALIAEALEQRYGIARPLVIHNVFPWADRATLDCQVKDRRGPGLSLYWYSQVISLKRGLTDAIRALALLQPQVQLHLRGLLRPSDHEAITALAQSLGVADRIIFHQSVPPGELLSRAVEHDVGLALEPGLSHSLNNALTVSNKLFFYLLAGLAVAATDTPGQRGIMELVPQVGALYAPGDHHALAAILRGWQDAPGALRSAQRAALAAARERWSWEHEQQVLLDRVAGLLGGVREASCDRRR